MSWPGASSLGQLSPPAQAIARAMTDAAAVAVEIEDLRVRRGEHEVLHGLSLSIAPGTVTGLLGPSGSGKTTLMRAIVGVQVVDSGSVRVLGQPAGAASVRARVGYVTQARGLYEDLTVLENARYFCRIAGAPPSRAEKLLATVRLESLGDRVVRTLSGGEQARASLATALVGRPAVLVLDEPTVGLDPLLRRDLWRTFHRLADEGVALLVSSHVMDEAANCDELVLLRDGDILARATPDELRERTHTDDLAEAFLRLIEREPPDGRPQAVPATGAARLVAQERRR
jgi:ABC-2 type transport system ATP-binding protein